MGRQPVALVSLETMLPGIRFDRVVAFARLGFEILVGELDVQLAVGAVLGVVEGSVADGVLAAHFLLQLLEDDVERVLAVDSVNVAAGVVGHSVERAGAGIAHAPTEPAIGAGIGILDAIDDGVGLLGGHDGFFFSEPAAFVNAIGDDDDHFAAHLLLQLIVGGQIDGVIEDRAARAAGGGNGARAEAADAGTHAQIVHGVGEQAGGAGVVLQQLGLFAEADEESFVLLLQDLGEELGGGAALDLDQVALAARNVDQEADGEGEIGFAREILDGLRLAVFEDGEILFGEVGDECALFVADGGQDADDIDIDR